MVKGDFNHQRNVSRTRVRTSSIPVGDEVGVAGEDVNPAVRVGTIHKARKE